MVRAVLRRFTRCAVGLGLGLLLWPAHGSAQSAEPGVLVLPASGGRDVPRRQLKRLQAVLDAATDDRRGGGPTALSPRTVRQCEGDEACLLRAGRKTGAGRIVLSRLEQRGESMHASTTIVDPNTGGVLWRKAAPVPSRYRLRGVVEDLFDSALSEAKKGVPSETGAHTARDANGRDDVTASTAAEGRQVSSSAPGYAAQAQRPEGDWAGDDGAPPLPGTQTGDAFEAKKAARDRSPTSFSGPVGAGPKKDLDWRGKLASMRSAAQHDDKGGRGLLMGVYMALATLSFLMGIAAISLLHAVGRVAKSTIASTDPLGAKKQAENQALLRSCCKQLTPGIIMSTEFETVRHFHFALLDGKELSIHVTDYQDSDESAFRPGAMVCAQFSHERRACVAMMLVKRARHVRGQMRVQLHMPEHMADIVLPRHFHVPVPERMGLIGQVVLEEGEKRLSFVSRVSDMSSETLCLKVDADTPELPLSCTVQVSLRLPDGRADIAAKYEGLEGGKVMLRVLPELAGRKPSLAYKELFKRIEAAWVAPAA